MRESLWVCGCAPGPNCPHNCLICGQPMHDRADECMGALPPAPVHQVGVLTDVECARIVHENPLSKDRVYAWDLIRAGFARGLADADAGRAHEIDQAATRARDEAFAEVALHLKHLVEAAALDDPTERRRKAEAVLAQISADIANEGKPLSMRLAEAHADGLRCAVGVFVRQAIARGHRNSQTIDLAARECEALAVAMTSGPAAEGPHA